MINYFRREFESYFYRYCYYLYLQFCKFNFFNEKSVTKIFEMNENILLLNQELLDLQQIEEKLMTKIKFLSFETLNEDYVSELAQKTLGMIKEDNVLVILDE